jgi:uncharacterized membrane protein YcaP (DUF421 family)
MESILRAAGFYLFLLVIFTVAGKRALSEMDTFDFILLLIISEAAQPALTGNDNSITNSALVIITLVMSETLMSVIRQRHPKVDRVLGGGPIIIVQNGKMFPHRMRKERVEEADVLKAARQSQGLERLDQIKFAILEEGGEISIIPKKS